ncbi:MAG TPA: LOG family protein [Anaerolineales bacterium]|nr:LOG family protein [Anaerolineales bacterium]
MKIVSVFGSAQPQSHTPDYQESYRLGQLLAQAGYAVMTGGYAGVMSAVSEGAASVGGHVIGVTCGQIERTFPSAKPNRWLTKIFHYETLRDRLYHLVSNCDAAITMPGGIGTLSELTLMWSLLQTGELPPRPLLAVGEIWSHTLQTFLAHGSAYVKPEYHLLVQTAPDIHSAISLLTQYV